MNKSFTIVWNAARNMYVVASELARSGGYKKTPVLAAGLLLALSPDLSLASTYTKEVGNGVTVHNETITYDANDRFSGRQDITAGGQAYDTTIGDSALQVVDAGGVATRSVVMEGGKQAVWDGGKAEGTTVEGGGIVQVDGTGKLLDVEVRSGGTITLRGDGTATGVTIDAGGRLNSLEGAGYNNTATNLLVSRDAFLQVNTNDTVTGEYTDGHTFSIVGHQASNLILNGGNGNQSYLGVEDGGTAKDIQINGGTLHVAGGGVAYNTVVNNYGGIGVDSGAKAFDTLINSGGIGLIQLGGESYNTQVNSGGVEELYGGKSFDTQVNQGGEQKVRAFVVFSPEASFNGTSTRTVINNGGKLTACDVDCGYTPADQLVGLDTGHNILTDTTVNGGGELWVESGNVLLEGTTLVNTGGILTSASGIITNNGTLAFNESASRSEQNPLQGTGSLVKSGDGTLTLTAANTYSGLTSVNAGTLWLDNGTIGASGSTQGVVVADSATFGGNGTVNGSVTNSGTLAISKAGETSHTLTINGDYQGNNGRLNINTQLGDDTSPSDKLVITGDATGSTSLFVTNAGGLGALTSKGIEVVDVGGSSAGDTFTLGNRVQIDLYEYRLYQDTNDGDWYLRSRPDPQDNPQYRPDIGAYLGNQWMARNLQMQTLDDREGSQFRSADNSVWMRFKAGSADSTAAGGNVDIENNYSQIQLGGDVLAWDNGEQSVAAGLMASYIDAGTDSTGNRGADGSRFSADGKVEGYNLGVYATWFADAKTHSGMYVDSWYQYGFFDNSVNNGGTGSTDYDSTASAVSLEAGYRYDIALANGNTVSLTPQAQMVWQNYDADGVKGRNGTLIEDQNDKGLTTRLGLRVDGKLNKGESAVIQPFAEASWLHTSSDVSVSFNDAKADMALPENRAQVKAGIQVNTGSQWSITGQITGEKGDNDYGDVNGSMNVRYSW